MERISEFHFYNPEDFWKNNPEDLSYSQYTNLLKNIFATTSLEEFFEKFRDWQGRNILEWFAKKSIENELISRNIQITQQEIKKLTQEKIQNILANRATIPDSLIQENVILERTVHASQTQRDFRKFLETYQSDDWKNILSTIEKKIHQFRDEDNFLQVLQSRL